MNVTHSIIGIETICRWALARFNIKTSDLLSDTGIDENCLSDPHATVEPKGELQFYRNLTKLYPDPHAGLNVGFQLTASTYGVWGLALQSSATILDGIRTGLRYIDLTYTFNHMYYRETEQSGVVVFESGEGLEELAGFMLQRDLAAAVRLAYDEFKSLNPIRAIYLDIGALPRKEYYENVFGCEIRLNEGKTEIHFDKQALSRKLNQANPLTSKLCREQLDLLSDERKYDSTLCEKIQKYLVNEDQIPSKMGVVANSFGLCSRSLRRKLAKEGACYKDILENARQKMAQEYLQNDYFTLSEIAEKLGYSDSVSFSHAYKRWFNKAPRSKD